MKVAEKEGDLLIFDIDILNIYFLVNCQNYCQVHGQNLHAYTQNRKVNELR